VLGVDEGNVDALRVQELIELQRGVCSAGAWVVYDHDIVLRPHHCCCGGCSHGKTTKGGELLLDWVWKNRQVVVHRVAGAREWTVTERW
jgi:hypothetical protein